MNTDSSEDHPPGDRSVDGAGKCRLRTFDEHRKLLFAIAYRMLGSVSDAEDMLQETYIRWQQAPDSDIRSPRAFLVTIISRLCLNHLQSARIRREEYFGEWLPEPLLTESPTALETLAEVDDSLSLAFLVLLERLTPTERAVFLLREVFEYEYGEIAAILGETEANCRQLLRRARQRVGENRPRFETSPQQRERLLKEFLQAIASGDLNGLVQLLSSDATLHSDGGGRGPALPTLIVGADKVARAILGGWRKYVPKNMVTRIAGINRQPGAVGYVDDRPFSVVSLEIVDARIRGVYLVTNPEKLAGLAAGPRSSISVPATRLK